eukprot:PhM_4_TR16108/c0_g1_i1/m.28590
MFQPQPLSASMNSNNNTGANQQQQQQQPFVVHGQNTPHGPQMQFGQAAMMSSGSQHSSIGNGSMSQPQSPFIFQPQQRLYAQQQQPAVGAPGGNVASTATPPQPQQQQQQGMPHFHIPQLQQHQQQHPQQQQQQQFAPGGFQSNMRQGQPQHQQPLQQQPHSVQMAPGGGQQQNPILNSLLAQQQQLQQLIQQQLGQQQQGGVPQQLLSIQHPQQHQPQSPVFVHPGQQQLNHSLGESFGDQSGRRLSGSGSGGGAMSARGRRAPLHRDLTPQQLAGKARQQQGAPANNNTSSNSNIPFLVQGQQQHHQRPHQQVHQHQLGQQQLPQQMQRQGMHQLNKMSNNVGFNDAMPSHESGRSWSKIHPVHVSSQDGSQTTYAPGWTMCAYNADHTHYFRVPSECVIITRGSQKYIELFNAHGPYTKYRFQLCWDNLTGTCRFKDMCSFIHCTSLTSSEVTDVHYKLEDVAHAVHDAGTTLRVYKPNSCMTYDEIPSDLIYVTQGSQLAFEAQNEENNNSNKNESSTATSEASPLTPTTDVSPNASSMPVVGPTPLIIQPSDAPVTTSNISNPQHVLGKKPSLAERRAQHCAHFYLNNVCTRGSKCNFIHIVMNRGGDDTATNKSPTAKANSATAAAGGSLVELHNVSHTFGGTPSGYDAPAEDVCELSNSQTGLAAVPTLLPKKNDGSVGACDGAERDSLEDSCGAQSGVKVVAAPCGL